MSNMEGTCLPLIDPADMTVNGIQSLLIEDSVLLRLSTVSFPLTNMNIANSLLFTINHVSGRMGFILTNTIDFSLNSVTKYLSLQYKDSNLPPSPLLCKRPECCHSASKTHVRDRIFKFSPIQASLIYQVP